MVLYPSPSIHTTHSQKYQLETETRPSKLSLYFPSVEMLQIIIRTILSRLSSIFPFQVTRKPKQQLEAIPQILHTTSLCPSKLESFSNNAFGLVSWHTLLSSSSTNSDSLTVGIATLPRNGYLALHRHAQAEVYYILEGMGTMMVGGRVWEVGKGDVVFVPGGEEHGIWNGSGNGEVGGKLEGEGLGEELKWLYVFACDDFGEIQYQFS